MVIFLIGIVKIAELCRMLDHHLTTRREKKSNKIKSSQEEVKDDGSDSEDIETFLEGAIHK